MAKTLSLFPLPGTFQDKPLVTFMWSRPGDPDHWPAICRWAANLFSAEEDQIDLREVFWGGEYGDDNYREALTVCGEIVGVFDEPLDADGWRGLLGADAMQHPSLIEQVRAAARARAAQSAH